MNTATLLIVIVAIIVVAGILFVTNNRAQPIANNLSYGTGGVESSTNQSAGQNPSYANPTGTMPASSSTAETGSSTSSSTSSTAANAVPFTVSGKNYSFTPATLTVKKGSLVQITFRNISGSIHDLVIPSLNAGTRKIAPGEVDTIQFTADRTGSFEFYCSVDGHRGMGMIGTLKVTP